MPYLNLPCFALHSTSKEHVHYILISLGNICYESMKMRLCNVIELHVLDHQVPHATLVLSFFKLHVTHCNSEN